MADFSEQRNYIKLCHDLGKTATETFKTLRSVYGKNAMCRSKTFHWFSRFKDGRLSLDDNLRSGRPSRVKPTRGLDCLPMTFVGSKLPEQLSYVKLFVSLGKSAAETCNCLSSLFGAEALNRTEIHHWFARFKYAEDSTASVVVDDETRRFGDALSPDPSDTLSYTLRLRELSDGPARANATDFPRAGHVLTGSATFEDYPSAPAIVEPFVPGFLKCDLKYENGVVDIKVDSNLCPFESLCSSPLPPADSIQPSSLHLNRMHVMDGDCAKSDIVAEKAPELDLPPSTTTSDLGTANSHNDVALQKPAKKEIIARDAEKEEKKEEEEKLNADEKTNGEVVNDSAKGRAPVVNGVLNNNSEHEDSEVSEMKCEDDLMEEEEEEEEAAVGAAAERDEENSSEMATITPAPSAQPKAMEVCEEDEALPAKEDACKKDEGSEESKAKKELVAVEPTKIKEEVGAACSEDEDRHSVSSSQIRKRRSAEREGDTENGEHDAEGEVEGEGSSSDSEGGTKRQRVEVEAEDERERLVREYVERCTQSVEEMSRSADKLQREIGALGELARAKELEWNSILRLRKLKEEMLERLLRRRRQAMILTDNGLNHDWATDFSKPKTSKHSNNQLMMVPIVSSSPGNLTTPSIPSGMSRSILSPDTARLGRLQRPILPKPLLNHSLLDQQNTVIGEGRQGPILDVKSIIADYSGDRSRHPENVPRRGRRMKSPMVSSTRISGSPALMSMANMALCSGAHIRNNSQDVNPGQENSRPSSTDSTRSGHQPDLPAPGLSFKDVLVQFAKMSHPPPPSTLMPVKQPPPPPPPYPEVTLHPVPAPHSPPPTHSSLLHGILTKTTTTPTSSTANNHRPTTFSPTLARLLTAPERERAAPSPSHFRPPASRVSISDLLTSSKKTRNEITITPVSSQSSLKSKDEVVLLDDEEETDSTDRLVIDEGSAERERENGNSDVTGEDVPECQGCHQRTAQFVCAGCGNQWYCSRECQVTAWEEHSEMCSG